MHPHLPNQTVLLPAQVEEGAHHSGYRKSRQGPSQLTKSEVPSRLSPVARLARRSRPSSVVRCCSLLLGPAQQADQITSITSIAFCSLLSFHPLLPLHPSSPVSPLSAREPAPSAGQGTRLYRTWRIIRAHRRTRDQARQGKGQQSSAGKPAVNSRRRPVKRLPRARQATSSCHLTDQVTCLVTCRRQPYAQRQSSKEGCETQSNGSGTAGQAKHAAAAQKDRAKSFQHLDLGSGKKGSEIFRQISISHLTLCLCSASQSGPWRLLKRTHFSSRSHTATTVAVLYSAATVRTYSM